VEDNPQGTANYGDNWGNYVMMRSVSGDHVLLAHLLQGSVAVEPGQRVTYTSFLGSVGNSGRSTVAHLHMHVQEAAFLGAPTKPFRLANYHSFGGEGGRSRPGMQPACPAKARWSPVPGPTRRCIAC
jgi:murein DD-endopeptidase MepM/ murein hydrolase activator NlpD